MVITWPAIGSCFSFSAPPMTCDTLSYKVLITFPPQKILDMIHYRKFPFTELQGKLLCSEKPSRNSCHQSNTSNPNLPSHFRNMDFCFIFKSVCGSTNSTKTRTHTGWSGVQLSLSTSSSFISETLSASIPVTLFPSTVDVTHVWLSKILWCRHSKLVHMSYLSYMTNH